MKKMLLFLFICALTSVRGQIAINVGQASYRNTSVIDQTASSDAPLNISNSSCMMQLSATQVISCAGCCDGQLHGNMTTGTPSYMYSLNGGAWGFSGYFSNLCAGTYTVCGKDTTGCTVCSQYTFVNPAGISVINASVVRLFPNPCQAQVLFDFPFNCTDPVLVKLYDFSGREVLSKKTSSNKLDISEVAPGIYEVLIRIPETEYHTKLIKDP